jgi:hypothetical protein
MARARDPLEAANSGTTIPVGDPRVLVDERGIEYVVGPNGQRVYSRPALFTAQGQQSSGGIAHKPDKWNSQTGQWEKGGLDWGRVLPLAGLAGMTGGAALAYEAPAAGISSVVGGALGPSTAANIAATSAAAGGAATGGGMTLGSLLQPQVLGAGINAFTNLYGAHMSNDANARAAQIQAEALRYQAEQQSKAVAENLAFLKAQAEADWRNSEINRRGNYDIYASGNRRLSLGSLIAVRPSKRRITCRRLIPGFTTGGGPSTGVGRRVADWRRRIADDRSDGDIGARCGVFQVARRQRFRDAVLGQ